MVFGGAVSNGDANSFWLFKESSGRYHVFVSNRSSREVSSLYEINPL